MDKNTLSNYGWIVIAVLVLSVMIALSTPFGKYISNGIQSTTRGLINTQHNALGVIGAPVPAECGVDGHWTNDGLVHEKRESTCINGHIYKCECGSLVVPEGGTYTLATPMDGKSVYVGGEQLPCGYTGSENDTFVYGDYNYLMRKSSSYWTCMQVSDTNKTSYGPILAKIGSKPVRMLRETFKNCTNLTTSPKIPEGIENLYRTFYGCTALINAPNLPSTTISLDSTFFKCTSLSKAPIIPNSTTIMAHTFSGCSALKTAPIIPKNVVNIKGLFEYCETLTGRIVIDANPTTDYSNSFAKTKEPIVLDGTSSMLNQIATTATKVPTNVTVAQNSKTTYKMTNVAIANPYMGFAQPASSPVADNLSLVYIDITFKELQPDNENEFAFDTIAEDNRIEELKQMGKHAVLRFVCDFPEDETHNDIPDWLMSKTGDGVYYEISSGKGYCPNYNNTTFIQYHEKAIQALANYFNDGFVSYIELGSLGHHGEWNIKDTVGLTMPNETIRNQYVMHYVNAFKDHDTYLLMRRPFNIAKTQNLGIYNDMAGHEKSTNDWLDWINNGGDYHQTGETNQLSAMPDFWKTTPSGGEFTSSLTIDEICNTQLGTTIGLLQKSHTTFLGPKTPYRWGGKTDGKAENIDKIVSFMGYRYGITEATRIQDGTNKKIQLKWQNSGVAPIYFNTPVYLYQKDAEGNFIKISEININLKQLLPEQTVTTETIIGADVIYEDLYIGIIDTMTNKPAVKLVSNQDTIDNYTQIF